MATTSLTSLTPIRGSTAMGPPGASGEAPQRTHPRHLIGSTIRAIGVFADTAFRVVILGTDGTKQPDPAPHPAPRSAEGQE